MSDITLTSNIANVSVDSTTNTITVGKTTANIIVGAAQTVANSSIRNAISNTFPILYDVSTGVISIDEDAIVDETVVDNGILSGNITLDLDAGRLHKVTADGDVTGITFSNIESGRSATVILTQDGIGGNNLDTTTHASNWTGWEFANQYTTIDTNADHWSVLSVFYDGVNYYASVVVEEALTIQNNELANSNVTVNGVTIDLGSSGTLTTDDISQGSTNLYYANSLSRAALSTSILPASGGGLLAYNDGTGVFTFTPADITDKIELTDLSVTTNSPSGNGSLSYNNTNGVFTFTPADAVHLTNAQVQTYIQDNGLNGSGDITMTGLAQFGNSASQTHTFTGNVDVTGNIEVSGNLNYRNVEDLYVRDQSITLNANAATDATVSIIANRPVAGSNTIVRWNETSDVWEFTNDGSTYYPIPTSTSDLAEGTNLYYTQGRFDTAFGNKSTTDLSEGTNLYYTDGRFDTRLATKTTSDLAEGTNLYYTDARANTAFDARNLDSSSRKLIDNVWVKDFGITDNLGAGSPNYYFPNGSPGSAGQFLLTSGADQLGFSDFTDESNSAISAYTGTMLNVGNITSSGVITADDFTTHNINQAGTDNTGINVNLSNTSSAINVNMPFLSNSNVNVTDITSDGYAALVINQFNPVLLPGSDGAMQNDGAGSPSANAQNLFAFVANATVTAGNTTVVIDSVGRLSDFFGNSYVAGNSFFSDAANITTILGEVRTNSVVKADRMRQMTQAPFAKGTYISSIDASNATITVSQAPIESATLTASDGGTDVVGQNCLWMADGAFNTETNYAEMYIGYNDINATVPGFTHFPYYTITCSLDRYGAPKEGYTTGDLTYTTNNPASWTAATYTTSGRTVIDTPNGYLSSPYGLTVGDTTTMGYRAFNDNTGSTFGINVGWDGISESSDYGGSSTTTPQISLTQYTDNTTQESSLFVGPRLFFSSRNGNVNVGELSQYPRATQELGRLSFWGTTGFDSAPPTNSPPGYVSVAAEDDWTDGSNTNMYFVATSNFQNNTSRDPFLSYEAGELILTSGQPSNSQANIQFAPAVQVGSNPQDAYDFSSDAAASGSHGWATVNYSNVSGTSGAEISINNGMSVGAGTVGDMKLSLHRKDNSYTANTVVATNVFYTAAAGGLGTDLIQITSPSPFPVGAGNAYLFSGITDSNWTFLNGNVYSFSNSVYGDAIKEIREIGGAAVTQGGASGGGITGQYEFVDTVSSGVTDKTWALELAEQSEDLVLSSNNVTKVTFSDNKLQIAPEVVLSLANQTSTEILALTGNVAGDLVYNTTEGVPAYFNGDDNAWLNMSNGTAGQFFNNANITAANTSTQTVTFPGTTLSRKLTLGESYGNGANSSITTLNSGYYNIQVNFQAQNTDNATDHDLHMWLTQNNVAVPGSTRGFTILKGNSKAARSFNYFVDATANDIFELKFDVDNVDLIFVSEAAVGDRPAQDALSLQITPAGSYDPVG